MADQDALDTKYDRLVDLLRGMTRVIVAFSGGVDSTFLARAAKDALGDARDAGHRRLGDLSGLRARGDAAARRASSACATRSSGPASSTSREYARNAPNRCFFCKEELFTRLEPDRASARAPRSSSTAPTWTTSAITGRA